MQGNLLGTTIQDPDRFVGSNYRQRSSDGLRRNGVIVQIETDVMGFAGMDRQDAVCVERMKRQRHKPGLFFLENVLNGSRIVSRPWASMGNFIAPLTCLAVEIVERRKRSCREERSPYELDRAFHAAFFVAAADLTRADEEVVVGAKLEQTRVELYGVSTTFQNRRAKVVAQNRPRHAAPILEGVNMATQEVLQLLVEEELEEQSARIRQSQHKAGQLAFGTADLDGTEVRPVDLGLLSWEGLQPKKGLAARRSEIGDGTADRAVAALVPSGVNHLVNPCRPQTRIPCQGFPDKVGVRIYETGPRNAPLVELLGFQSTPHRVRMQPGFSGNRADFPVFCVEKVTNLSNGITHSYQQLERGVPRRGHGGPILTDA